MCRSGHYLARLSNSRERWKTCWLFVSVSVLSPYPQIPTLSLSSQCVGSTAGGQDFESFLGVEKAKEFKELFSSWIYKIYRAS